MLTQQQLLQELQLALVLLLALLLPCLCWCSSCAALCPCHCCLLWRPPLQLAPLQMQLQEQQQLAAWTSTLQSRHVLLQRWVGRRWQMLPRSAGE